MAARSGFETAALRSPARGEKETHEQRAAPAWPASYLVFRAIVPNRARERIGEKPLDLADTGGDGNTFLYRGLVKKHTLPAVGFITGF